MVGTFDNESDADKNRDTGLIRFVADLFAARTPDNCDDKDCRFRSGWCFHSSHGEVYSEESQSSSEATLNPQKASRASD